MIKIRQYKTMKFESGRLKESKFNILLTFREAEKNGEVVSFSDSELLRVVRRITGNKFTSIDIDLLMEEREAVSRLQNSKKARNKISEIDLKLEKMIFISELITVLFDNKNHYLEILGRGGFSVNGHNYVPLLSGAGMMRKSSVMFVREDIRSKVDEILNNGRADELDINPSKFGSYYALSSSASIPVTFPRLAVVSDRLIKTIRRVNFGHYDGSDGVDPTIEEKDVELECNAFDGQGLISPELAKTWSADLGLDYDLSTAIIRASWIKGMVVVFPIHRFAAEVVRKEIFTDIYGNEINIKNVDCIVSESMFKLWNGYSSTEEYVNNCKNNGLGFGVARISPKQNKTFTRTSYQFIQVLDIDSSGIDNLINPTLKWLEDVAGGNWERTLLYMMGEQDFSPRWFEKLEPINRAILLDGRAAKDPYSISRLESSLEKKKHDAKLGRLLFRGCYSTMISDPYAQMAHVFGMQENLLNEGEHFSRYWNERGVSSTVAIRSPIVHSSEINKLNYRKDSDVEKWFSNIGAGIIYPCYGIGLDPAIHSGSDFDGDEVCTIDDPTFMKGRAGGLPILYDPKKAPKEKIRNSFDDRIHESQVRSFGTKIGFFTNVSSSMWSLIKNYSPGTREYEVLRKRLQYFRILQGEEIDAAKTGNRKNFFPSHFVKYKKITSDMSEEEAKMWSFNNSILSDKRPLFMRWLYPDYQRKYKKEMAIFDSLSKTKYGMSILNLMDKKDRTEEEDKLIQRYRRKSFFISNDSTMNILSERVEDRLRKSRAKRSKEKSKFDYSIYLSLSFNAPTGVVLDKMSLLFKEYTAERRSLRSGFVGDGSHYFSEGDFDYLSQIRSRIWKKAYATISSNASYLGDLAVYWAYNHSRDKSASSFVWSCFGEEIVKNMMEKLNIKSVRVPQKSKTGTIEYLWDKYSIFNVSIE